MVEFVDITTVSLFLVLNQPLNMVKVNVKIIIVREIQDKKGDDDSYELIQFKNVCTLK